MRNYRRWTHTEDTRLLRQVKAYPQNLHKCFMIVAEEIGRSENAVANRWYGKVSKNPEAKAFFIASPHHVSMNRKNGEGERSTVRIWNRLLRVLGL